VTDAARTPETVNQLRSAAFDQRSNGNYLYAADLFRQAARLTDEPASALNSQMRRAHCLVAAGSRADAVAIAERVAQRARAHGAHAELVDALALLADDLQDQGRVASTVPLLAEATWLIEQMPDNAATYLVVHNMADTYARCGFHAPAIQMFQRAIRLAPTEVDRQFAAANLTASYHLAALAERDLTAQAELFESGLATAGSVIGSDVELEAGVVARSHRAAMLAHSGHTTDALREADSARAAALVWSMREEELVAMCAQAIARWRGCADRTVLTLVDEAATLARTLNHMPMQGVLADLRHEILWDTANYGEARRAMLTRIADLEQALDQHIAARWSHVRESIDNRRIELLTETDPLTGLGNAAYLTNLLGQELGAGAPVCIAVLDIDGFRDLNDAHGYATGDRVLQELAKLLERVSRRGDMVVRLGGDEFAMVLRDTSVGDARHTLERVRQQVATRQWESLGTDRMTLSIGLTVGSDVGDSARLLTLAREALHEVKREGGNAIAHR
jgi:diguanylate cyclase (GGDEF)-like protein